MLRIHRANKSLTRLDEATMADLTLTERHDLQELIFNSPREFFAEIGLDLFVLAKELIPSQFVQDRIDLLALDTDGNAVIMELKRGNNKLQLLQAIGYAAMISQWKPEQFQKLLDESSLEQLTEFLSVDLAAINSQQRILLMAEAYDFEVLVAAEWLQTSYNVDITCARLSLSIDAASGAEYLSCSAVFPTPELAEQAIPRRAPVAKLAWEDWDAALASIKNSAVADFFRNQIQSKQESNLGKRLLCYRLDGKRRFFVSAKTDRAYCWQEGRFDNDIDFWSKRLAAPASIAPVKDATSLRFSLSSAQDFSNFLEAATRDLKACAWMADIPEDAQLDLARAAGVR